MFMFVHQEGRRQDRKRKVPFPGTLYKSPQHPGLDQANARTQCRSLSWLSEAQALEQSPAASTGVHYNRIKSTQRTQTHQFQD